jgi:toxin ParE1/3/4
MSLLIRKSEFFAADFELQYRWYDSQAGEQVASRYLLVVDQTLAFLAIQPGLGRVRHFRHPELQGLRSFHVEKPFDKHLIFYRHDDRLLEAVRIMHGARNLPQRLVEAP